MGYGGSVKDAAEKVGRTGDGGIDGVIKEDKLGLDVICVQAKRWQNPVGVSVVREFVGSLLDRKAKKGVLITTSSFFLTKQGNMLLVWEHGSCRWPEISRVNDRTRCWGY